MKRDRSRAYRLVREGVLDDQPLCVDCLAEGRTVAADEVDHVVPLHQGGTNERSNLAPRCRRHHAEKSANERNVRRGRLGHTADGVPIARLVGKRGAF